MDLIWHLCSGRADVVRTRPPLHPAALRETLPDSSLARVQFDAVEIRLVGPASGAAHGSVVRPRDAELRCKRRPQRQRSDDREAGNPDRARDDVSLRSRPRTPAKPSRDARTEPDVEQRPQDEPEYKHPRYKHLRDERGPELGELKERQEVALRYRDDRGARLGRPSGLQQG